VVELWKINPDNFNAAMRHEGWTMKRLVEVSTYMDRFHSTAMFKGLKPNEPKLIDMVYNATTADLTENEVVCTQGEKGDKCFILGEGSVSVVMNEKVVCNLTSDVDIGKMHHFGELSLIARCPRAATVLVSSDQASLLFVEQRDIENYFGSIEDLLKMQSTDSCAALRAYRVELGISAMVGACEDACVPTILNDAYKKKAPEIKLAKVANGPKESPEKGGKAKAKAGGLGKKIRASVANFLPGKKGKS